MCSAKNEGLEWPNIYKDYYNNNETAAHEGNVYASLLRPTCRHTFTLLSALSTAQYHRSKEFTEALLREPSQCINFRIPQLPSLLDCIRPTSCTSRFVTQLANVARRLNETTEHALARKCQHSSGGCEGEWLVPSRSLLISLCRMFIWLTP